ncbi:Per1-domain-containing protein [Dichomitus squalens]|uniref:Post-GPI attachment to proteins factor 3 n=1 Tax=Dichomitus squalens TaxID=114155 RepID=A0A4Q9MHK4_9APHY|nr:Per1-domain-containing protein [Dichomitus squalens]TBU41068.1 Per1-domain-containing protein [Dichomitus squalens]TBU55213.1 Per1-domain-containing protein [Dichomitus squalens]
MKGNLISLHLLLGLSLVPAVVSSSGDRADEFQSCVSLCQSRTCEPSSLASLSLALRLTRWTCVDDCKYQCMHLITNRAIQHGWPVQQYYGKWPFWRFAGMQEPASVLFSIFNLVAHFGGLRKIQTRVPDSHPMKKYYITFAFASMNAWVWSSVFHTRDLPTTEKLDYFSAALAILYALYYTVIRLFHIYPIERDRLTTTSSSSRAGIRVLWTLLCTLAFLGHVSYLTLLPRFDYSYNMIFNLAVGMSHNLLWLSYSLPSFLSFITRYPGRPRTYRPRHAYKPALFALLTTAATALELFDFPPWGELPSFKILETDLNYVFLDIGPVSEGHALIVPKFHSNRMDEVPDEHLAEILPLAKKIAKALDVVDYNILQNNGKIAFQHVFHVHFHVIPKPNEREGLILDVQHWPRKEVQKEQLAAALEKIQARLELSTSNLAD